MDGLCVRLEVSDYDKPVTFEAAGHRPSSPGIAPGSCYTLKATTLDDAAREADTLWPMLPIHEVRYKEVWRLTEAVEVCEAKVAALKEELESAVHQLGVAQRRLAKCEKRFAELSVQTKTGFQVEVCPHDIGWGVRVDRLGLKNPLFPPDPCTKEQAQQLAEAITKVLG